MENVKFVIKAIFLRALLKDGGSNVTEEGGGAMGFPTPSPSCLPPTPP